MVKWEDLKISSWWDSEAQEFQALVLRLLASLPGGDEAEDLGYEPFPFLGWQEVTLITEMLDKIQDKRDVEGILRTLFSEFDEDDDYEASTRKTAEQEMVNLVQIAFLKPGDSPWDYNDNPGIMPWEGAYVDEDEALEEVSNVVVEQGDNVSVSEHWFTYDGDDATLWLVVR